MDSNQTRFQLLLGFDDWSGCTTDAGLNVFENSFDSASAFSWNSRRSELTLGSRINVFHSAPANIPPTLDQRRGAAQDRFGNWYWIADSGIEILVTSVGTAVTTHFWSSPDESATCPTGGAFRAFPPASGPARLAFSGLAITSEHYLVAGVRDPAGLVIFDLFHGGPPRQVWWPSKISFSPFDMAPAPNGGLWILDRMNHRLWALDRSFGVIAKNQEEIPVHGEYRDPFQPVSGRGPTASGSRFPTGMTLESASPIGSIDAIAMEALPDGTVLLLENTPGRKFSDIYRFRDGRQIGDAVSLASVTDLLEPQDRAGFQLLGGDFAFIPIEQTLDGSRKNTVYVAGQNGDQAWAFTANFETAQFKLTPQPEYYPMRRFGGKGIVAGQSQVFYDSQNQWVPLVVQKRPRYVEEATLFTRWFDGKQPDCVWHRLMLDASVPADTKVQIWSRAGNDRTLLGLMDWGDPEPLPYRRGNGTEVPWTSNPAGLDTWELLFQRPIGQYLQLKITLSGNGRISPRIRALRAYYPRFSYLNHYLPGVYREDQQSAWFLDRFLSNMEGFFTSIEDRIASVQALFDEGSIPSIALDWLANWFGVALDPSWSDAKRQLFLRNAMQFFEARGTIPGLLMALRLAIEDCVDPGIFVSPVSETTGIRIVEAYRNRYLPAGLFIDPSPEIGLPVKTQTGLWTPAQGAADLDRRYATTVQSTNATYPAVLASTDPQYAVWKQFSLANLGVVPSQPESGSELWVTFLRTRYGTIKSLNAAYGQTFGGFAEVSFPSELPRQSSPLWDWYQFQGVLLIEQAAHQFTVFLPMPIADAQNTIAHRNKMNLARRVVDLEKPSHTTYEIKFYWAFFRVGQARLGRDSVLDYGSRAPQLLRPMLLGDNYLGSGYLSRTQPGTQGERPFLKQGNC